MFKKIRNLFPTKQELFIIEKSFTKKDWYIFSIIVILLVFSTLSVFENLNRKISTEVPTYGGSFSMGVVGTPRYINPVLALTDSDRDISSLVYSGLVRQDTDGSYIADIAESWDVSEDGKEYTFTLKKDLEFHDGSAITADDVIFTIKAIQNADVKSPTRIEWQGVEVESFDDYTIVFRLSEPFSGFLDQLTVGILPSDIWQDLEPVDFTISDYNSHPIGSGPFKISHVEENSSGIPSSYTLTAYDDFALGRAYIDKITFKFYPNEKELIDALKNSYVDSIYGVTPKNMLTFNPDVYNISSNPLPRVFGLFFNKASNAAYANKSLLLALEKAIDKEKIVNDIFYNYASVIDSAVPVTLLDNSDDAVTYDPEAALASLSANGWNIDENGYLVKKDKTGSTALILKIATSDTEELIEVANYIKSDMAKIGVMVEVQIFDIGTLNQDIIRTRDFDVLLFGEIVKDESDLFAFWHSSQRNDPGLNVTSYTSTQADSILEKLRRGILVDDKQKYLSDLAATTRKDMSAIFIYSPHLTEITKHNNIKNNSVEVVYEAPDRLGALYKANINSEYIYTFLK